MHEESTRLAGEYKGAETTVLCKKIEMSVFCVCTCSSVLEAGRCFVVSHNVSFYSVSAAMLYFLLKFRILQRCSRVKNNISISQG